MIIFFWLIGAALYFIPTFVAFGRDKSGKEIILILNIVLGWTLLGWIFLLIWAFSVDTEQLQSAAGESRLYRLSRECMPQKECTQCGSQIDYDCSSCPNCGHRFPKVLWEGPARAADRWECKTCGDFNNPGSRTCLGCGNYKS